MNLQEIVDEISERAGHNILIESIVRKVDNLNKQLFRRYINDTDISIFDIYSGISLYPLSFPWQDIQDVVICNEVMDVSQGLYLNGVSSTVRKGRVGETSQSPYYYVLRNLIGIWPTPIESKAQGMQILRRFIPEELNVDGLEKTPDLDAEYHMLLVYGVTADLLDGAKRNEYLIRYNELLSQFISSRIDRVPQKTISVTGW